MRDNNYLNIMEFWTRKKIPYVFDETLSLYQLVRLTVKYLNEVIKDQNELKDAIKEFIEMFDKDLEKTIIEVLEQWKVDGSLKEIINEALFESKLDKSEFIKYKQDQMSLDSYQTNEIGKLKNDKLDKTEFNKEIDELKKNRKGVHQLIYGEDGKGVFFMHRGLSKYLPENTYISFDLAGYMGAKGLEMDIQPTKDGNFVVMHDTTLNRTTNGTGNVSDKTLAELKSLKITGGNGIDLYNEESIPELSEILHVISRYKMNAILELKGNRFTEAHIRSLISIIDSFNLRHRIGLMSFDVSHLEMIRRVDKDFNIGYVMNYFSDERLKTVKSLGNCYVSINHTDPRLFDTIKQLRNENIPLTAWTVNSVPDMVKYSKNGLLSITSDNIKGSKPTQINKSGVFYFDPVNKEWVWDKLFNPEPFRLTTHTDYLNVQYVIPFEANTTGTLDNVRRGISRATFWGGLSKPYFVGTIGERASYVNIRFRKFPEMTDLKPDEIKDKLYIGFSVEGYDFMP